MNSRERVKAAMHYRPVDKAPLQFYYCPVGYYEHGEKLNDLYATLPGDFEPFQRMPVTGPAPEEIDENGRYHGFYTDEWGVVWEKRIFGVTGIPYVRPLENLENLSAYHAPEPPRLSGEALLRAQKDIQRRKAQGYYTFGRGGGIYERLISLCGDENALCGMMLHEPETEKIADLIMEHARGLVQCAADSGADGISMGDDYGAERSLLMSPALWRSFIKPRLAYIMAPAIKAGMDIHFHSCGYIWEILADLKALGVTSIWPQLPAYNMEALAKKCRELELAVAIHTDRANTMTYGSPDQVRDLVRREYDVFRMGDGGSWFYVEADNGFPFENIEALVTTIAEWR